MIGMNKEEGSDILSMSRLEQIVERYQTTVFTIGVHLTAREDLAEKVVEEVFVRLAQEVLPTDEEALDKLIHQISYEAAIEYLLSSVQTHCTQVSSLHSELCSSADREFADAPKDDLSAKGLADIDEAMSESENMLIDIANELGRKKYYC